MTACTRRMVVKMKRKTRTGVVAMLCGAFVAAMPQMALADGTPNLVIPAASVSKKVITLSESLVLHWRVENVGDGAIRKTKTGVALYDVSGESAFKKMDVGTYDCVPLAAGGGREYTKTISGKTLGVGEYNFWVCANSDGSVGESDLSDNGKYLYIRVEADNETRSSSGVDWQFRKKSSAEPAPFYLSTSTKSKKKATTFKVGQKICMRCCWWNATKRACTGNTRVAISLNGHSGVYTEQSSFPKNSWWWISDRTPSFLQGLPAGKYTLTATLDSENNWVEKNENNNVRRISFTVVDVPKIYGDSSYSCGLKQSVSWPVSSEGSMTVKGLPPGLKYSGGAIVGKPTKAGTYQAKFTSKNAAGKRSKTIKIVVSKKAS